MLLAEIVNHTLLMAMDPAGDGEHQELQRGRHDRSVRGRSGPGRPFSQRFAPSAAFSHHTRCSSGAILGDTRITQAQNTQVNRASNRSPVVWATAVLRPHAGAAPSPAPIPSVAATRAHVGPTSPARAASWRRSRARRPATGPRRRRPPMRRHRIAGVHASRFHWTRARDRAVMCGRAWRPREGAWMTPRIQSSAACQSHSVVACAPSRPNSRSA